MLQIGMKIPKAWKLIKDLQGSNKFQVKGKLQDFLQKILSLKQTFRETLHFISFTSNFAVCEICSNILVDGSCMFIGIEPSTNDFMI